MEDFYYWPILKTTINKSLKKKTYKNRSVRSVFILNYYIYLIRYFLMSIGIIRIIL